jgi:lipoprotein-releasing system permease protein
MIYEKWIVSPSLKLGFSGDDVKWVFVSLSIIIGFTGGFWTVVWVSLFSYH